MTFSDDITNALNTLRDGGVILYPTDTIWGLGCDPSNREAVKKIFSIKQREDSKSLILLASDLIMVERYVKAIPDAAYNILNVSDKPITIIYPEGRNLAEGICSSDGSVGIRICEESFCSELIKRFRKPLVSTSANISGEAPPANFRSVDERITGKVDYVVTYRQDDSRIFNPSPVIKVDYNGVINIIRK